MIMKIRSLKYHFKEGAKSVMKNGLMSFASIASVTTCAFMLILSLCVAINLDGALEKIEETIGVSVYIGEDISEEEIKELFDELQKVPNVRSIDYVSKQDALEWAKEEWGDEHDVLSGLEDDNPFPRSFELAINGVKYQRQVISDIERIQKNFEKKILEHRIKEEEHIKILLENYSEDDKIISEQDKDESTKQKSSEEILIGYEGYEYIGIDKIRHAKTESDILLAINNTVRVSSVIIIMILALISVAIIVNTIKLTVYVRKNEINIMKYVGATDWFIRWPFVIEGIIIGIIGSIIAIIICIFGYSESISIIYEKVPIIKNYIEFKNTFDIFLAIAPVTIILGALLGVIGSVNSIKRHLNV